ncbi:MAG: NAD(P)-dependent alcohol dehydrogenase [Flavobacteriales bacterium]|nr:NAD(P)-dependent alcohol dehydrogenase [Flavobacteriales bacterium]
MKAAIRYQYGGPAVISIEDVPKPNPKKGEVLIRVHSTTINRTDGGILRGKPYLIRAFSGLSRPRKTTPGTDFAGVVESIGEGVTSWKPGDRVMGLNDHGNAASQAEFMVTDASVHMIIIPEGISYQNAVASLEGAHYALNFLNKFSLQAGDRVLINGGTGGIGSAAIQLAKAEGLHVTATSSTAYMDKVKALGADEVIDYTKEDFTLQDNIYDHVFDEVGKRTFFECRRILKPGGIYISTELGPYWQNIWLALITPLVGGRKVIFPVPVDIPSTLVSMRDHLERGSFSPLIDRSYSLADIREGYTYVESGEKKGNVILELNQSN